MKLKAILLIALSLIVVQTSFAKDQKKRKKITVSGYVLDENSNPIEGVSIIVDGESLKKVTNKKGFYKIKIKPETKTLMMYSLAHGSLETDFRGNKKINFILSPNAKGDQPEVIIDDVVNVGYGWKKKEEVTISNSEGFDIKIGTSNAKYNSIYDMIKSKYPNVKIVGNSVIVRGLGSMNLGNGAIFVVDGAKVSSIRGINPSMVESISILKGSAASIYGMNGANGAVVITTKAGK